MSELNETYEKLAEAVEWGEEDEAKEFAPAGSKRGT